jgi:hypothetical protein
MPKLLFFLLWSLTLCASECYKVLEGNNQLIVVAGHAMPHTRKGRVKRAELGTGELAQQLHKSIGCTAIIAIKSSTGDPNYDPDSPVKKMVLERKPKVVLDLHGAHPDRDFAIDLGTMNGRSLLGQSNIREFLEKRLRQHGIFPLSRDFFSASRKSTMTCWLSERDIPCVQIEINSKLLPTPWNKHDDHTMRKIAASIAEFATDFF